MPPRSADAIEAAVVATGLLDVGAPGPVRHSGDVGSRGGSLRHSDDVGFSGVATREGPLLLLCSAGRDSACLLDLAVRRRGPHGVRVLHVDHGLRAESRQEAELVRRTCAALGVEFTVARAGRPPETGNLHAWARGERARLAAAEAERVGAAALATAHTRTDLVETALFRLATQPGRRALLSMRAVELSPPRPASQRRSGDVGSSEGSQRHSGDVGSAPDAVGDVPLLRPLLDIGRDETLAYGVARGLRWAEDASNADRRFARARLRHAVTPILRSLNPRFEEAVVRTLRELADERDALDAIVASALPTGSSELGIAELVALPRPVARLVLRELCERETGRPCARATARLDEVLERAAADRTPFALDVGDGARVVVRGGVLHVASSAGPAARAQRGTGA